MRPLGMWLQNKRTFKDQSTLLWSVRLDLGCPNSNISAQGHVMSIIGSPMFCTCANFLLRGVCFKYILYPVFYYTDEQHQDKQG